MKKKSLLIHFDESDIELYHALVKRAKEDRRTLPNTAKELFKMLLKK